MIFFLPCRKYSDFFCHKFIVDLEIVKNTKHYIKGSVTKICSCSIWPDHWATSVMQSLCHVTDPAAYTDSRMTRVVGCDVVRRWAAVFTLPYRCPGKREQYPRASQTHWSLMWIPTKGKQQLAPNTTPPPLKIKTEGNHGLKRMEWIKLFNILWILCVSLHVYRIWTQV